MSNEVLICLTNLGLSIYMIPSFDSNLQFLFQYLTLLPIYLTNPNLTTKLFRSFVAEEKCLIGSYEAFA